MIDIVIMEEIVTTKDNFLCRSTGCSQQTESLDMQIILFDRPRE